MIHSTLGIVRTGKLCKDFPVLKKSGGSSIT